ncbi:MAG: hypothetical protein ABIQ35_15385 [Verrucomicrobiota bacterium]
MSAIDFITAFGQLLRDGSLRDAFAANPQMVAAQMNLRNDDLPALLQLIPEDLEFQARVLLSKRLDVVRRIVPETCRRLAATEWPAFHAYARSHWPNEADAIGRDAHNFCRHLKQANLQSICQAEWNRLEFAFSERRFAIHHVERRITDNKSKTSFQIFLRTRRPRWHEIRFYFGL